MQFLNPIWLWGLTGLLIPIGIHLLSRKEGKVIKIGSIRHLEDSNTKQFKSIRLNELILLSLRCLLIASIVFFLSGLHYPGIEKKGPKWLLVEKGLEHDPEFITLIDSLEKNGFEIKALRSEFPDLKDSIQTKQQINYWALVEELKTKPLEHAIILSYNYADGFRGKRIALPNNVQWISKNPHPIEFPLFITRTSKDSALIRLGESNSDETHFINRHLPVISDQSFFKATKLDSVPIEFRDTISIALVSDSTFAHDKKMILTALNVLKETCPQVLIIETFDTNAFLNNKKLDWLIWLSEKPVDHSNNYNTICFKNSKGIIETSLLQQQGETSEGDSWILTKRLNQEIAIQENLTVRLGLILLPKEKFENRVKQFDRRVLPEKLMWAQNSFSPELRAGTNISASQKFIVALLFIILLIERILAFKRNQ